MTDFNSDNVKSPQFRIFARITAILVLSLLILYVIFWLWHENRCGFASVFPFLSKENASVDGFAEKSVADSRWELIDARISASPWHSPSSHLQASLPQSSRKLNITFEIDGTCIDVPQILWPDAKSFELLRATSSSGDFKSVSFKETAVKKKHMEGKPQPNRNRYVVDLTDSDIQDDGVYFYKIRFFDSEKKRISETGFCSTCIMSLPKMEYSTDQEGFTWIKWAEVQIPNLIIPLKQAWWVIRLSDFGELARYPLGEASSCKSPIKESSIKRGKLIYQAGIEILHESDVWSLKGGQGIKIEPIFFSSDIPVPRVDKKIPDMVPPAAASQAPNPGGAPAFGAGKQGKKSPSMGIPPHLVPGTGTSSGKSFPMPGLDSDNLDNSPCRIVVRSSMDSVPEGRSMFQAEKCRPDSGSVLIFWEMPSKLRLKRLTVKDKNSVKKVWQTEDQSIYNMGGYTRLLGPGLSERIEFIYNWDESKTIYEGKTETLPGGGVRTTYISKECDTHDMKVAVAAVRTPLPSGLTATSGNGFVHLSWNPIRWDSADWIIEPYFVLRRSDSSGIEIKDARIKMTSFKEFIAGTASSAEYLDKDIKNGQIYFYKLEVRGVSRALSWTRESGSIPCNIAVRCAEGAGLTDKVVVAQPAEHDNLRIALFSAINECPQVYALQMWLERILTQNPSIELVERSSVGAMLNDKIISELLGSKKLPVPAANILLQLSSRKSGNSRFIDVWMEDPRNSRRERLASVQSDTIDYQTATNEIIGQVRKFFSGTFQSRRRGKLREER